VDDKRTDSVQQVDWSRPWLAGWREPGQRVAQRVAEGLPLAQALNAEAGAPVCFVAHEELPAGQAYEDFIFRSARCPTRDGLHDFFNGLCWLQFPQTKKKLNQLQAAEIVAAGILSVRGPVRDALTVFDENAALLLAPQALWDALLDRDWRRLFVDLRSEWQQAQLLLFGHALLEKLVCPRKPITAHVYLAQPEGASLAELDAWIASDLTPAKLTRKPFLPLPVLGVPGWWPANEEPAFYADPLVFRPLVRRTTLVGVSPTENSMPSRS
jgi:hypothetical protein